MAPFEDLKKEIAEDRAVMIVGAGVSLQATGGVECASWAGLLRNGAQSCAALDPKLKDKWLGKVLDDIDSDDLTDLLSAAYKITEKLGGSKGGEYGGWLHDSVGSLGFKDRQVIEAIRDLGVPIATTNYDGLIEEVTGFEPVTWRDHARVENVLQGRERAILHVHGYFRQPESVVLGIKSYEETVNDEHAQAVLRALALMKTLVFVGYGAGLGDPNFRRLLQWREKQMAGSEARSYRLALEGERESLQKEHPPEQRILVLSYGQKHQDLEAFLRSLAPVRAAKPAAGPPGPAPLLPPPRACFGRQAEIDALVANLLAPQPQPFPVLGGPGIGKSTITITALYDPKVVSRYAGRRYFVRCEAAPSRSGVVAVLARLLGIDPAPGIESAVLATLATAPSLLVLDNFETPWEAEPSEAEDLLGHLAAVPGLALVASVRGNERPGGVSWAEALRTTPLNPVAARQAFLAIAGRKFETDPLLDSVLEAVDRVPLAIDLLAHAAEPDPTLENLWQRWQTERTALLKRGAGADRLSNIEMSYEISWSGPRMTPDARRLSSVLARLPAGIAAAHLSSLTPVGPGEATALRRSGLAYDEADRLRILAPIREYVSRVHPPQPEDLDRAAGFYRSLLTQLGFKVGEKDGREATRILGPEAKNIEEMALASVDTTGSENLANVARAWAQFARCTGVGSPKPVEQIVAAIRAKDNLKALAESIESLGYLYHTRSDHTAARVRYEEALQLYRQMDSAQGEACCITGLGQLAMLRAHHFEALKLFEEALRLFRRTKDAGGEAGCLSGLADIALRRADHLEATRLYEEALPLYRQVGSVTGEASTIGRLGEAALRRSDDADARRRFEQALSLFRQVGELTGEANCILSLSTLAMQQSDYAEAQKRLQEALPLFRQVGSLLGEANCMRGLGDTALARSDRAEARQRYEEALALYQGIEEPYSIGGTHQRLARIAANEPDRARHVHAAREAWLPIDRPDLVQLLDDEFGAAAAAAR